jgi:hypothetical protein
MRKIDQLTASATSSSIHNEGNIYTVWLSLTNTKTHVHWKKV